MAEGLGEVALADAGGPDEEDILVTFDEAAGGEVGDLLLGELGAGGEVEGLKGLLGVEGGAPEPHLELVLGTALDLVLEELGEELDVRELGLDGEAVTDFHGLEDAAEPQALEHRGQLMDEVHVFSPWAVAGSAGLKRSKKVRAWVGGVRGRLGGAASAGSGSWSRPRARMRCRVL